MLKIKSIKLWLVSLTAIAISSTLVTCGSKNRLPPVNFSIFTATDSNGDVVFHTIDMGYKDYGFKNEFPWHLLITVETKDQNENGHPTEAEADVLNELEDSIHTELAKVCQAHYIGRSTFRGDREIIFYVDDLGKVDSLLLKISNDPNFPRPLEFRIDRDESWSKVEHLLVGN